MGSLQEDFEKRKTGLGAGDAPTFPDKVEPHKFVPWPNHVACAWCCGAVSNKHWHTK